MRNIVELRKITRAFGAVIANREIDLSIQAGTIHAIVGENGAGKSTIMKILYGFYTADSGEILIDGQKCQIRSPNDAIGLGLGMVHQHFMLVPPMTVLENIILGAEPGSAMRLDLRQAAEKVEGLIRDFGFELRIDQKVESLSVGQQQRVELVKALYRGARILILDEPTAVLTPHEVEEFFRILRRMREQGKTVIIVTHKLNEVLAISDNVTVMRDGQVVGERRTAATSAAELARLMVGRRNRVRSFCKSRGWGWGRGSATSISRSDRARSSASPVSRATARPNWSRSSPGFCAPMPGRSASRRRRFSGWGRGNAARSASRIFRRIAIGAESSSISISQTIRFLAHTTVRRSPHPFSDSSMRR